MSSNWGCNLSLSIFGESHGLAIGAVLDGLPPGIPLDLDQVAAFMARRAPGSSQYTTPRKEADLPVIQSGFHNGYTTGTPLCAVIANTNAHSKDYGPMASVARPGHADYAGFLRYSGFADVRGGGHFSGRLTAPLVFAGAVALQALALRDVHLGAHIAQIHNIKDNLLNPMTVSSKELQEVTAKPFPVLDEAAGAKMRAAIDSAREQGDSVGGVVECAAVGYPAGIGSPMFDGLENSIASILFAVPAVKGVEFGEGFGAACLLGSENNDAMKLDADGEIITATNRHGGILGGISSGMPIIIRAAFKPTPSISKEQDTVDFIRGENTTLSVQGRHDPCIVPRAVPCVEACVALALLDRMLEGGQQAWT